ncbi:MAG: hypothetical protein ACOVOR_04935 [Rhabdochlamydiaceae bacterium]
MDLSLQFFQSVSTTIHYVSAKIESLLRKCSEKDTVSMKLHDELSLNRLCVKIRNCTTVRALHHLFQDLGPSKECVPFRSLAFYYREFLKDKLFPSPPAELQLEGVDQILWF